MKNCIRLLAAALTLCVASFTWAEVAVIVHPSASFDSLTEDDVSRLFLGKSKSFPGGAQAVPVNQNEGAAARDKFNEGICKKNASQYKAYWSQLVFTGKGTPPKDAGDDAAVKALVAANPNMIGYVDASAVDASVKVVFKLP
ncbi:MAG TPA: phosphate ABC transporter substrate-binding protein [Cellvibrio sp.]|nr:phosphate ABC transporter substrate-binding protein [Cellvibrio sp.]